MLPGLISNRNDGSRVGKSKCGNLQIAGEEKKGSEKENERKKINQRKRKQECLEQQGKAREKGEFGKYFLHLQEKSRHQR